MKSFKKYSVLCLILFALSVLLFPVIHCGEAEQPDGSRDLILVIDTSRSMIGQGGKNIFPEVKESLKKFIDELQSGDSLTVMTFDEGVRVMPTIDITHESNRDIIKHMIYGIEAKGMWTYSMGMLREVFSKAEEFEKKNPNRKQVIVMLTDGLDDPPPSKRKERFNIKDAAKDYMGKEWFIYLVNFGEMKENSRFQQVQAELRKSVSSNVHLIEGDKSAEGAIQDVQQSMQEERERNFFTSPIFFAILIIVVLLALFIVFSIYSKIKVAGNLEYYNYTLLDPYINTVNLARFNLREVRLGKHGADLILRDYDGGKAVVIKAFRHKGKIVNKLIAPEGISVEFVNRETGEFLNDGDVVKVANYSLKYMA